MKFTKPFRGCANGDVLPRDFATGDDCPPELEAAAREEQAIAAAQAKKGGGKGWLSRFRNG